MLSVEAEFVVKILDQDIGRIGDAVLATYIPAESPAACSFSTLMICSSVNLLHLP
jgi:hypothetical protein